MNEHHIGFDELYHLAQLEADGMPFSEAEKAELRHLIDCEECYERYCAIAASIGVLWDITGDDIALAAADGAFENAEEMLSELGIELCGEEIAAAAPAAEGEWERVGADVSESVISIAFKKVRDALEAVARQIGLVGSGFSFESPLSVGGRGAKAQGSSLKKLEDIQNSNNCITVDPTTRRLTVQFDAEELETQQIRVYLVSKDGMRREILLENDGEFLTGRIDGITEDECELHIERELDTAAEHQDAER